MNNNIKCAPSRACPSGRAV